MIFILLILISLASFIYLAFLILKKEGSWYEKIPLLILSILVPCIISTMLYVPFHKYFVKPCNYHDNKVDIIPLHSGDSSSGPFILGSGSVNKIGYYSYYYVREDGNYKKGYKRILDSSIKEMPKGSEFSPHVKWKTVEYKCPAWVGPYFGNNGFTERVFVVPHGTTVRELRF